MKLNSFEEIAYARSSYETSLWRVHTRSTRSFTSITVPSARRTNPGASTRRSIGTIRIPDRGRGFTKRTSFRAQSEYRFAVSTLGDPVESKRYIAVSPELRAPVSALCPAPAPGAPATHAAAPDPAGAGLTLPGDGSACASRTRRIMPPLSRFRLSP